MNGLSFDLPIWGATIYHSEPGATNPWTRSFNVIEIGDEKEDELQALKEALGLFGDDFGGHITIYQIQIYKLLKLEGGEDAEVS